jgi:hypothetical protein
MLLTEVAVNTTRAATKESSGRALSLSLSGKATEPVVGHRSSEARAAVVLL